MAFATRLCTRATTPTNLVGVRDARSGPWCPARVSTLLLPPLLLGKHSGHLLLLLALMLSLITGPLSAQSISQTVIGNAGAYYSVTNTGNLHFTVGEIVVDRTANGLVLERGFHQGYQDLLSTSIWLAPEVDLSLRAYPNPSYGPVFLEGSWEREDRAILRDLFGRPVLDLELPPNRAEIDLSRYPAGTYFLSVVRGGRPLGGIRLVRQ
jgi:hypothetical protein